MYPEKSEGLNYETETEIFFFTTAFEFFSSFSAHQVTLWGETFPTAEHAYQWKKYERVAPDIAEHILHAKSPDAVKRISDQHKQEMPSEWHEQKVAVMEEIFRAKTQQHADVQEGLIRSGNKTIIENSPVDSFWGNGPNNDGENVLGKTWMKIRDEIL